MQLLAYGMHLRLYAAAGNLGRYLPLGWLSWWRGVGDLPLMKGGLQPFVDDVECAIWANTMTRKDVS